MNGIKNPLVSIIIPVYNAEHFISETLESIIKQSYTNWKCIIVDDGSTDNVKNIISEFIQKDKRFKYYYQQNAGPSKARNAGLDMATGEFIQFLDADDILLPDRFKIMLSAYLNADYREILYSDFLKGDSEDIYITTKMSRPSTLKKTVDFAAIYENFPTHFLFVPSCVLFPHCKIRNVYWNESLNHSEDWDYYLRITSAENIFRSIKKPLVIYRDNPDGLSKQVEFTIQANYQILYSWLRAENYGIFLKRSALLFKGSIIRYLLRKSEKLQFPKFVKNKFNLKVLVLSMPIYFLVICFLIKELLNKIKK